MWFGRGGERASLDSAETLEAAWGLLATGEHQSNAGATDRARQRLVARLLAPALCDGGCVVRTATAFDVTARSEASEARTATSSYRSNWITPVFG